MTQTSESAGQIGTIKDDTDQKPVLLHQMQRITHLFSSTWLLCILIGVIALGFNLYRLGDPSIWYDEAFSVELARQPLPLLWHIIWGPEPNMELYYLFLHFWLGFTGFLGLHPTEFVVRFPSAVFAALSSVMVFLLGRRFLGITDRKSTRLNSSHSQISYAVFCLKKNSPLPTSRLSAPSARSSVVPFVEVLHCWAAGSQYFRSEKRRMRTKTTLMPLPPALALAVP